jgi:PIN domain nuclease of toxin-antitoxin system
LAGKEVVIDSSAAIALAKGERDAETIVPQYLTSGLMSAVNLAEFVQVLRRSDLDPEPVLQVFEDAGLKVVPADSRLAWLAGELERTTRSVGLSLGDRFCLALAISGKCPVVTTDRIWLALDFGIDVILARTEA